MKQKNIFEWKHNHFSIFTFNTGAGRPGAGLKLSKLKKLFKFREIYLIHDILINFHENPIIKSSVIFLL